MAENQNTMNHAAGEGGDPKSTQESSAAGGAQNDQGTGGNKEGKVYTDADIDTIISKKFAKWQADKEKEIDEAKKLGEMNAQQKAEYERDELQKKLTALEKANTLNEMSKTARGMLKEKGIDIPDELLAVLVSNEAEDTKKQVDHFSTLFTAAVDAAVKDKLRSDPPKTGSTAKMTKDEIFAIKDTEKRQQAIRENLPLFN